MSAPVTARDHGARRLLDRARSLARGRSVKVGVLADKPGEGDRSAMANVEVAYVQEVGAPERGIPARAPLRSTVDGKHEEIGRLQETLGARVLKGTLTEDQALHQLGAKVAGMVQEAIASNLPPPLKPETIERKGSSIALIDTGQLRSSYTWEVE